MDPRTTALPMDPRTTALLVIDLQQGFVNRHSRGVLSTVVRLVDGWLARGAPVALTRFRNEPHSPYETITGWSGMRTLKQQAIVAELAQYTRRVCTVIDKTQSSALTPEATALIRRSGWRDLVLCGVDTDACVYDSAVAAYHGGFRPWIVIDACASTGGARYHEAALLLAARNIGARQLVTSDDVLARLGGAPTAWPKPGARDPEPGAVPRGPGPGERGSAVTDVRAAPPTAPR